MKRITVLVLFLTLFSAACGKKNSEESNEAASARLTIQGLR